MGAGDEVIEGEGNGGCTIRFPSLVGASLDGSTAGAASRASTHSPHGKASTEN